jgi:3'-5' exoribonuclease
MKTSFVSELLSEQNVTSFFLVHEKELRNTREGRAYLRLELGDRSGTIEARMWEQFEAAAKDIQRDDFVKVQARVEVYRNKPQLALQQMRLAKPEEIDLADYLPHTTADVEKMFAELRAYADSISDPWLKKLTLAMISDPEIARCYKRAPAAKVMHHAYLGGLLEHVISLCGMAQQVAAHYPELDIDLLLTAAILHDVGKLEELCYERAIGYTTPGQLLGHIVMELETVTRAIDKLEGFPAQLKTVVQHLLISHHGQYEFGSPKLPMIREAMVFHYLDDLDSKLAAVRVALATPSGDEEWSSYSAALGRKFLRLDAFLHPEAVAQSSAGQVSTAANAAPATIAGAKPSGTGIEAKPLATGQPDANANETKPPTEPKPVPNADLDPRSLFRKLFS